MEYLCRCCLFTQKMCFSRKYGHTRKTFSILILFFPFQPVSSDGMFQIHAKFMGVRLEHVDIDIQDLLQLQYEGVAVMNVFGKAKINVNLLLFLLNTKFYTRKRR